MNKVILCGNLGADAELKVTQSGKAFLKFSLATTETWKDKDGNKQEKASWHRCQMWGDRAEKLAQHLTKGTKLLVDGSIEYGSYEKDGVKHYTTDIKVFNVEFTGGKKGDAPGKPAADEGDDDGLPPASVGGDEIPF